MTGVFASSMGVEKKQDEVDITGHVVCGGWAV